MDGAVAVDGEPGADGGYGGRVVRTAEADGDDWFARGREGSGERLLIGALGQVVGAEHNDEQNIKLLPERLRALIERSKALQRAVSRLDATMHATASRADRANPVERQIDLLKAAFEQER